VPQHVLQTDRHPRQRASIAGALLIAVLALLAIHPATSRADACTPPVANAIACENSKPGTPQAQWMVNGIGDPTIQGFATAMSVDVGDTESFKVKSQTTDYHVDVYRLGYYDGAGARLVQPDIVPSDPSGQPDCMMPDADSANPTGLVDCGNWHTSLSWSVPADAVSGVYIARLQRDDGGGTTGASVIPFVVRNDADASDMVFETSDETWEAYNSYGGNSLYTCTISCPPGNPKAYKGAFKVSYNRPFHTANDDSGRSWLFNDGEYAMIRYLEANGYDVSYISGVDANSRPSLLLDHKVFLSVGHDEYWSGLQRTGVEAARDAGVNLAFFSGNEVFWKTRFEPSQAGATTPDRTLVSYKDTHYNQRIDPVTWTGSWRDPRFITPADHTEPENALTGQSFVVNSGTSAITVPFAYKSLRLWRNTAVTGLAPGQSLTLAPDTLGYEWDVDADNGFRPAGEFDLSSTTMTNAEVFTDYGSTTQFNQTATHNLTEYRAPSGALVFGAGTVHWAWGLDDSNPEGNPADKTMQQATMNLFADMGVQPATREAGLVAATQSTDTTPPTAKITSIPSSTSDGTPITISGTATDAGGGVVAGVEVSTDGGASWHPASGTTSWSYKWIAHGSPSATIAVRATDDSGNIQTPGPGTTIAIGCPCSIWGPSTTVPASAVDSGDANPTEVGLKFSSDQFGSVSGLRFYKAAANTGTHVANLWDAGGTLLARATVTGETASGWQTAKFATPVQIQPNTTYVVSYYAPNGHYSASQTYFYPPPAPGPNGGALDDSPPLHALLNAGGTVNGVYSYGKQTGFPTSTFGAANYWVDPIFSPEPLPGTVTNVVAAAGGKTSANLSWSAPSGGGSVTSYKITPYVGGTAQPPTTVDGGTTATSVTGLTTGTTYTFKVQAVNPNGAGPASAASNAVTPLTAVPPSAPTVTGAVPASQAVQLTWTAPLSNGDATISGYTITPYVGTTPQAPVQAAASATSATVSGLSDGTSYTFRVTATNSAGTSQAGVSGAAVPEQTLLDFGTPAKADAGDPLAVELGVKFTADGNGAVTGIRFYKSAANTGAHSGSLWDASGHRLAQVSFANETASGWQTATFSTPVQITAGTTYVASYYAPNGHYSTTAGGFAAALDNPPLHALANAASANGVYAYGATSTFPSQGYGATDYWVDVLFAVPVPGAPSGVTATASGDSSAQVAWTAPASGGTPTGYRITPYAGSTALPPTTAGAGATSATVGGLTTGTTYTFSVTAVGVSGAGAESARSNAVTPTGPTAPGAPTAVTALPASQSAQVSWTAPTDDGGGTISGYTVTPYLGTAAQTPVNVSGATSTTVGGLANGSAYTFKVTATNAAGPGPASAASAAVTPEQTILDFKTPATVDAADAQGATLGVKFTSDVSGTVVGIRFYKAAANSGAHVGTLWSAAGGKLAETSFSGESASGWQTALFATPYAIAPNTTYVASYFTPTGHYSVTGNGLLGAIDNAPLHALADGLAGGDGVYKYGSSVTFPTSSFGASDYFVDVLFQPDTAPGAPTGVTATAGRGAATVSWTAPASGGAPTSYVVTPYLGTTAQPATTVSGSPPATSTTISGLTAGSAYTFRVQAVNGGGSSAASAASNAVTPTAAVAPAAPTGVSATPDTGALTVAWTPASDGGSPITAYSVTPYVGGTPLTAVQTGGSATSARVTGLTNGTSYTFTVTATNAIGTSPASAASSAVAAQYSLFGAATPATVDVNDGGAVNVGVKLTSDVAGTVTGIRFYKSANNTGAHVGALWSASGTLLAQVGFSGESASGWQTALFSTPVPIAAGTTYVASYFAPNGHYSATAKAFSAGAFDSPPLHALADGAGGGNGVYSYGSASAFPKTPYGATNYWVDVLFTPAST